jgi:hypothetical protein
VNYGQHLRYGGGRRRILVVCADAVRRAIRLGKCSPKQAQTFRVRVEALVSASITGSLDDESSRWLTGLDDRTHGRLAAVGLVKPRDGHNATLGQVLSAFFETLAVKPGTATTYNQTRRSLSDHFGDGHLLGALTPLACDWWRQSMRDAGLAEATISKRVKTARQIFRQGVRWKMLAENPFLEVKAGSQTNRARMYFVSDAHFARALKESAAEAAQNPAQSGAVTVGTSREPPSAENEDRPELPGDTSAYACLHGMHMTPAGFEPASPP